MVIYCMNKYKYYPRYSINTYFFLATFLLFFLVPIEHVNLVENVFKSLLFGSLMLVFFSTLRSCGSLVTSFFVSIFVSTFDRRLRVVPSFNCVECFFFPPHVMLPIFLACLLGWVVKFQTVHESSLYSNNKTSIF